MAAVNTTVVRCRGFACGRRLTDPVSIKLGYGPDCYEAHFGKPQPRPRGQRRPARAERHRGRDVVTVDLLTLAAAAAGDTTDPGDSNED